VCGLSQHLASGKISAARHLSFLLAEHLGFGNTLRTVPVALAAGQLRPALSASARLASAGSLGFSGASCFLVVGHRACFESVAS
jgi:hypothetical protein